VNINFFKKKLDNLYGNLLFIETRVVEYTATAAIGLLGLFLEEEAVTSKLVEQMKLAI
jgi:hypothetical protein